MRVINKPCVWTVGKGKGKGTLQVDLCTRESVCVCERDGDEARCAQRCNMK